MALWKSAFQTEFYQRVQTQLISDGINDVFFYFRSGLYTDSYEFPGQYVNIATGESQNNQPDGVFCTCSFGRSAAIARGIYKPAKTKKIEPFTYMVSVYTPKQMTDRMSDKIESSINKALNGLTINDNINGFYIQQNQRIPRFVDSDEGDTKEIFRSKMLSYNFELHYCDVL